MIVFLLGLLVFECYTAQNKLQFFDITADKLYIMIFEKLTSDQVKEVNKTSKLTRMIDNYTIPVGIYQCEFNSEEKKEQALDYHKKKIASLSLFSKEHNLKGTLRLDYNTLPDARKFFDRNLKLIAHRDNFEKPDQSTIVLPSSFRTSFRNILGFTEILSLCFDKNYVTIAIADDATFTDGELDQMSWFFDEGIRPHVRVVLNLKRTKTNSNFIQTFMGNI